MAYIGQQVSSIITIPQSGVSAGSYGNANSIPAFTVGNDGRITTASNVSVEIPSAITVTNDITTNSDTFYILLSNNVSSGTLSAANTSNTKLFYNANTGTLSASNFNNLSDESLKENILVIENPWESLNKVQGVEFTWKDSHKKSAGFIAQEIEKILPHLVDTSSDGIKSVNYLGLIAYLVETVKDLDARIKKLEAKN